MDAVRIERDGAVGTVFLERPDVRNAVDPETARALHSAVCELDTDADIDVIVLHGRGGVFCAGFDLQRLAADPEGVRAWLSQLHFGDADGSPPLGPMGPTRMTTQKPVIAAIAGAAVAGGMELALWCDLRVMEESAYLGVYCRRWGVPLIDGGTIRLPRLVGAGRAADIIYTGRKVEAHECERIGLCERVVADGEALSAAHELARSIAAHPQVCLRTDRAAMLDGIGLPLEAALRQEFERGLAAVSESVAGAARFAGGAGRGGAPA